MPRTGRPRKNYDYDAIWRLHQDNKWGSLRISRQLHLPRSSVGNVLKRLHETEYDRILTDKIKEAEQRTYPLLTEDEIAKYAGLYAAGCEDKTLDIIDFVKVLDWIQQTELNNSLLQTFIDGDTHIRIVDGEVAFKVIAGKDNGDKK